MVGGGNRKIQWYIPFPKGESYPKFVTVAVEKNFASPGRWIDEFKKFAAEKRREAEDKERLDQSNLRDRFIGEMTGTKSFAGETFEKDDIPF